MVNRETVKENLLLNAGDMDLRSSAPYNRDYAIAYVAVCIGELCEAYTKVLTQMPELMNEIKEIKKRS